MIFIGIGMIIRFRRFSVKSWYMVLGFNKEIYGFTQQLYRKYIGVNIGINIWGIHIGNNI